MPHDPSHRSIAVLLKALSIARGGLYGVRLGEVDRAQVERVLAGTREEVLRALIGETAWQQAMELAEALPLEDVGRLLQIEDGDGRD
jgi:hypothetical protein